MIRARTVTLVGALGVAGLAMVSLATRGTPEPEIPQGGLFDYSHCLSIYDWDEDRIVMTVVRHIDQTDSVSSVEGVTVGSVDPEQVKSVETLVFSGPLFATAVGDKEDESTFIADGIGENLVGHPLPFQLQSSERELTVAVAAEVIREGKVNPPNPAFTVDSIEFRDGDGNLKAHRVKVEQWITRADFDSDEACSVWAASS